RESRRTAPRPAPPGAECPRGRHAQRGSRAALPALRGDGGRQASEARQGGAMTFGRLLLRNLLFHRRGNFAVLLGVAVGTAVLTGALLVGDSLRGSLRGLALKRLGWVDHSLVAGRFFREEVA